MLLREMFSPLGGPEENDEDINWIDDLKFFIDKDDRLLNQHLFPAIKKHKKYVGHPDVYKLYIRPVEKCLSQYCDQFEIEDREKKFPIDQLIELAKQIAKEQEAHIQKGDYDQ